MSATNDRRPDDSTRGDAEDGSAEDPRSHGAVSIWRSQRGDRLWSVRVPLGASQADVDAAIAIALEAEQRLDKGGPA